MVYYLAEADTPRLVSKPRDVEGTTTVGYHLRKPLPSACCERKKASDGSLPPTPTKKKQGVRVVKLQNVLKKVVRDHFVVAVSQAGARPFGGVPHVRVVTQITIGSAATASSYVSL